MKAVLRKPAASSDPKSVTIENWGRIRLTTATKKSYIQYRLESGSWKLIVCVEQGLNTADHQRIGWHLFNELTKHPYITVEKLKTIRDKLIAAIGTGNANTTVEDLSEDEGSEI
eukprot:1755708-Alexandrium_andersonii.AAC.1